MQVGTVLQIEPTDMCNLLCPMCTPQIRDGDVHQGLRTGFLDMDLYRGVIDDIARERFALDHLILQWLGEPTLHPDLDEMVTYASRQLVGLVEYIRVDTNAIALTPSRVDRILSARAADGPPLLLVFSLDSVTAETYLQVMGRDRFAQVMTTSTTSSGAGASCPVTTHASTPSSSSCCSRTTTTRPGASWRTGTMCFVGAATAWGSTR